MTERVFRVGQKVRIVRSDMSPERVGRVTTVVSGLAPTREGDISTLPVGTLVHDLDFTDCGLIASAPPAWLEPYDDGRDAIAWTDELRKLCGIKRTERA